MGTMGMIEQSFRVRLSRCRPDPASTDHPPDEAEPPIAEAPGTPDDGSLSRVAYEIAVRALADQEGELRHIRDRTGSLMAAAALTSGFLGSAALNQKHVGVLGLAAIAAFAVSMAAGIYVTFPKRGFIFSLNAKSALEALEDVEHDTPEIHRRLAVWLEGYWTANAAKLAKLNPWLFAAGLGLGAEVVLWVIDLRSTLI